MNMLVECQNVEIEYVQYCWKKWGVFWRLGIYRKIILKNINWKISSGQRILLVGDNGVGKTTILAAISGLILPSKGNINYHGCSSKEANNAYPTLISDKNSHFYRTLSVRWNLCLWSQLNGIKASQIDNRMHAIIDMFNLKDILHQRVFSLSSGQYQRFIIAMKLLTQPELLLLDEPWKNIDENAQRILMERIDQYISQKPSRALIVTSHNYKWMEEYFDHIYKIEDNGLQLLQKRLQNGASLRRNIHLYDSAK